MTEPAFQRVEELFHQAVEVGAEGRAAFLDAACGGDAALRAAVQELLDHDAGDDDFLASPVARPTGGSDAPTLPAPPGAFGPTPTVPGYEILVEIGRGGMGVVYKARQLNLNRVVALKMLLPAVPGDPTPLARFRTEAEALARLRHPNIVPIYDFGESETHHYFSMEYVPGPNLARFLDRRPQDPAASAWLVETLARAMHAAHESGVVHRDLKPANILLAPPSADGGRPTLSACEPRVTDFGLALDAAAPRGLTQTGVAVGTPSYMAPEQARGDRKNVGPGTDIYSLGTILYEMLTGRPPFDAGSPAETMRQVVCDDPVAPSRLRPRLPRDLVTVCMKCLEKSPQRRYANALDLAEDLRRFRAGEPIRARPAGLVERACRWCVRRPLAASLLALVGVLGVGLLVTVFVYEMRLQEALRQQASDEEKLAEKRGRQVVRLEIAIGVMEQDAGEDFTALLYYTEALRLEDAPPDHGDELRGRIAAILRRGPRLVRLLTFDKPVVFARLGPSGGWAATAGADHALEIRDVTTGRAVGPSLALDAAPLDGAFSADGGRLVVIDAAGAAHVWDVTAGRLLAGPVPIGRPVRRVEFSADGERFILTGDDGTAQVRQAQTGERIDAPPPGDGGASEPPLGAAGGLAIRRAAGGGVCVWEAGKKRPVVPPLRQGGPVKAAAFRPDGKGIVVVGAAGVVCTWELQPVGDAAEGRPTGQLVVLAEVLAGARIDDEEEWKPLDAAGLKAAWEKLPHDP